MRKNIRVRKFQFTEDFDRKYIYVKSLKDVFENALEAEKALFKYADRTGLEFYGGFDDISESPNVWCYEGLAFLDKEGKEVYFEFKEIR